MNRTLRYPAQFVVAPRPKGTRDCTLRTGESYKQPSSLPPPVEY
jgi:hypothetical protein